MTICPLTSMLVLLQPYFIFSDAFSPSPSAGRLSQFKHVRPHNHHATNEEHDFSIDDCWEAETLSVNPLDDEGINAILQRVCSPAPQSYYVIQKATMTFTEGGTTQTISSISDTLGQLQYLIKPGYQWIVREDCADDFQIVSIEEELPADFRSIAPREDEQSTLEMAHIALEIVSSGGSDAIEELHKVVQKAKNRLRLTLGTDLRGRLSADAAFSFAVAGVVDVEVYDMLARVACNEFRRLGKRPSFRPKYILQMVEKLAASGMRGIDAYRAAADCLQFKGEHLDVVDLLLSEDDFDLLSTRPLLWVWRFSSRQSKVVPGDSSVLDSSWIDSLANSKKTLVVDIGCGMGVSLLGLATPFGDNEFANSPEGILLDYSEWKDSNLVGCDSVGVTVGYAQGIAKRWNLNERLQYANHSAQAFMEEVESTYTGKVPLVMIQFPSPYRLENKAVGNKQLSSIEDGFMVSKKLLESVTRVLEKSGGFLLLQSNVEDVAVTMGKFAQDAGFQSVVVPQPRRLEDFDQYNLPQRTLEWVQVGGQRAVGDNWSAVPLLPSRGSTETEVACNYQGTPVHRCLFRINSMPSATST